MPSSGQPVYDGLIARGFSAPQAAALAGNIEQESSFNPAAYNPSSDAYGLLQWRLDRKTALQNYAKSTGRDPSSLDAQLDYLVDEMQGPEAKNSAAFLSSGDVATANDALKSFIRYGNTESGNRLKYAQAFAGAPTDTGTGADVASPKFVNPAFSGAMPGVPSFGSPAAAPASAGAAPSAPTSDDDLLNAFLPGGSKAGAASATAEDPLLSQFLTPPAASATASAALPTDDTHSSMPWLDPISAAANSLLEHIPIAGPALLGLANNLDAMTYGEKPEDRAAFNARVEQNQPVASTVGAVTGEVAPYVIGGAIPGVAKALGLSGNLLTRVALGGTSNALIQGGDTLARGGSLEDAGKNALLGGAVGAAAAPVADVIGGIGNKLLGGTPEAVARLGQAAIDKFGIPVEAAQLSSNPLIKHAGDIINKIPGLGGTAARAEQLGAFNKAVANEMGETATSLTPDVMAAARDRIGNAFDSVAQRVPVINADQQFQNELLKAVTDAESTLDAAKQGPIIKQFENIANTFNSGTITGDQYLSLTAKNSILSKAIAQGGDIGSVASEMKDALFGALQRSAPADVAKDLATARYQWKVMRTIEPLVEKAPTGDISPALLMGAVTKNFGGKAFGQAGNMGQLADIAQRFLKEPNSSQTAERGAVMMGLNKLIQSPVGLVAGLGALAQVPGAITGLAAHAIPLAAGYATSRAAAAALRSEAFANKLISNALKTAPSTAATPLRAAARAAASLAPGQNALIHDVFGGVPGPGDGQTVKLLRPRPDGTGYFVQLPDGSVGNVGNALLEPAQ